MHALALDRHATARARQRVQERHGGAARADPRAAPAAKRRPLAHGRQAPAQAPRGVGVAPGRRASGPRRWRDRARRRRHSCRLDRQVGRATDEPRAAQLGPVPKDLPHDVPVLHVGAAAAREARHAPDPSRLDVTEFCSNEQRPTRLRVLVVLQFWIANYYDIDFVEPKHRDLLQAFINNIVSRTGHHAQGKEMLLLLEARAKQVHLHQQSRTPRGAATEHDPHAVVRYAEEDSIVLLSPRSSGSSASSASSSCS